MRSVRILFASAVALLAAAVPSLAVKTLERLTPKGLPGSGFTVVTTAKENGTVEFRIARDVTKARWQDRSAKLEVYGEAGPIVACPVEGHRVKNVVTYRFSVARPHVPGAVFTVAEIQADPDNPEGPRLIGGGTFYEFRLEDFAGG